jgi:formylglycine-generating enzyme required for sulfatase activity
MGDVFGEGNQDLPDETPVHEVCVKDFYLGKFEVTQEQWQKVMGENPSSFSACGNSCPVDSVSWDMAQDFIKKLNAMTKKKYRLPTEAEWEYAARSGGKNDRWPGTNSEEKLADFAWYDQNSKEVTHPVGLKKPNGLGLYDMAGNVREWCQDWYDEIFYTRSPKDSPEAKTAYKNPPRDIEPPKRSQRGGSFQDDSMLNRAVTRRHNTPDFNHVSYGVRLVLPAQ